MLIWGSLETSATFSQAIKHHTPIMTPIKAHEFSVSALTTKDVATRPGNGMKVVPTRYNGSVLKIQTPKMSQIFDIGEPPQTGEGIPTYNFNLNFRGADTEPKLSTFLDTMTAIDNFNLEYAQKHSTELFGKFIKPDIVEEFHKPIVKFSTKLTAEGAQYPPTMKVKLRFRNDKPDFTVYDLGRKELNVIDENGDVDLSMFQQGTKMINLLEYGGVWCIGKSFGATWRVVQTRIYDEPKAKGCLIFDSDDEDTTADDF